MNSFSVWVKVAIGIAGYASWAVMAYFDPTQRPDFLKFNIAMAVGTIGLVLRDMQPAATTPTAPTIITIPSDKQS